MRIFVVEQDGAGGLIHYAYQLCQALSGAGADVTLVTGQHYELTDLPHSFVVEPRIKLWKAVGTSLPSSRLGSKGIQALRKIRRLFRGIRYTYEWHRLTRYLIVQRPDIVQFSLIRFPFQAVFLRRLRRAGLILTQICHEFESRERGSVARSLTVKASRAVFDSFDLIYLHGENNRQRFHAMFGLPTARTRAIRHGNESLFLQIADHGAGLPPVGLPTALFFGGLRPSKGIEDLIDAWAHVRYEIDARLKICGEPQGIDPTDLRDRIERTGVAVSVEVDARYQPMEQVADLMRQATVVVLPYRSAAASGVLQVAYTFGVPVIATAVGTLTEDIKHGETGLLVEPGDISGLARALVKMLSDPDEARRMGDAARRASDRFGWEPIATSILADYRELTA